MPSGPGPGADVSFEGMAILQPRRRMLRHPLRHRPGWTLVELLLVLGITSVLLGLVLSSLRQSPVGRLADEARLFAQTFQQARMTALMQAGSARLDVDPRGRYRASAIAEDGDSSAFSSRPWRSLSDEIEFAAGAAAVGPLGDSIATAVPLQAIDCGPTGRCELGAAPTVTYYLQHSQDGAVFAITVSSHGTTRVYRYNVAGRWE